MIFGQSKFLLLRDTLARADPLPGRQPLLVVMLTGNEQDIGLHLRENFLVRAKSVVVELLKLRNSVLFYGSTVLELTLIVCGHPSPRAYPSVACRALRPVPDSREGLESSPPPGCPSLPGRSPFPLLPSLSVRHPPSPREWPVSWPVSLLQILPQFQPGA